MVYNGESTVKERDFEDCLKILKKYQILKIKPTGKTNKLRCSFYNQGFYKAGPGCMFDHPHVQRCKIVRTCEQYSCKNFPSSGKILAKFYANVSYVAISLFLVAFFGTFWNFMLLFGFFLTIWVFWAFYAVLLQITFVVIYALFREKLFWLKPCSCKRVVFLHLCSCGL